MLCVGAHFCEQQEERCQSPSLHVWEALTIRPEIWDAAALQQLILDLLGDLLRDEAAHVPLPPDLLELRARGAEGARAGDLDWAARRMRGRRQIEATVPDLYIPIPLPSHASSSDSMHPEA